MGKDTEHNKKPLRVIFMGMLGSLSSIPLATLIEEGINVIGVIVPSDVLPLFERGNGSPGITAVPPPSPAILTVNQPNILDLAFQHQIPLYSVDKLKHPKTISTIQALQPDVICVSCFSKRIPPEILNLPPHGVLNVHPSPLPYFRGPYPLFWIFRSGIRNNFITIHYMDEGFDTGDIAFGGVVQFEDGISGAEANALCGKAGGNFLYIALSLLENGNLPRRVQNEEKASYAPKPKPDDFRIETSWPARYAFNFMCGTSHWGYPYPIEVEGKDVLLATAVSFHFDQNLPAPIIWQGQDVLIQMREGVLKARIRL
ncbi:MAG: hypothetical protein GY943_10880 [Chloroflexi bacterium]|nr:hypothetical protein [Chloroflexota bacterium]